MWEWGQKKPDGFFVASVASTASCQMIVFQMLEVEGERREGWKEKTTFLFFSSLFFFFLKLVDLQVCEARQRPHILKQGEGFGELHWPLLASQPFRKKSHQVLRLPVNRLNCLLSDPKPSCFVLGFSFFSSLLPHWFSPWGGREITFSGCGRSG